MHLECLRCGKPCDVAQSDWEKEFWLFWGLSPEGTPKHKAGMKALEFISKARNDALDAAIRELSFPVMNAFLPATEQRKEDIKTINQLKK